MASALSKTITLIGGPAGGMIFTIPIDQQSFEFEKGGVRAIYRVATLLDMTRGCYYVGVIPGEDTIGILMEHYINNPPFHNTRSKK